MTTCPKCGTNVVRDWQAPLDGDAKGPQQRDG